MKVLVAGDFVPRNRVKEMVEIGDYSFFDEVIPLTAQVDYSIVNFESPVVQGNASPIVKTGPNLRCHPNAMKAVRYAGFSCVTLANNHFYDYGEIGVSDTLNACKDNGINHVGGGINIAEAESVLFERRGTKSLAIVNFCENEWSIATSQSGGSAPLDLIHNTHHIQEAKKDADYVLVIIHGGTELYQLPTPRMKETYRFFIEQGADAVINHHQHCFSGYEVYLGRPIFYGIGNFCFDNNDPNNNLWNEGYVVVLNMSMDKISFDIMPYSQCSTEPKISFLDDLTAFFSRLYRMNAIIADDVSLNDAFIKMARSKRYLRFLEPYNNKFLKLLNEKGFLPSLLKNDKKKRILEVFRCESYRDIMFELLEL